MYVTAEEPTSGTSVTQFQYVRVVNQAPVIDAVHVPAGGLVGDDLDLRFDAHDPDSTPDYDDLGRRWACLRCICGPIFC